MSFRRNLFFASSLAAGLSTTALADVNLVKLCNYRAEPIWATYAIYWDSSNGWYRVEAGACIDLEQNYRGPFDIYAFSQSGWNSSNAVNFDEIVVGYHTICTYKDEDGSSSRTVPL